LSKLLKASAVIYVFHYLLESKTALCENLAFWTILTLGWAMARKEVRFSWHILYFPLILYGVASTGSAILADRRVHQAFEGMLWFKMLIFPAAVILHRNVPWLRDWMVRASILFGGGMAVWGLLEFFVLGQRDLEHRMNGPTSHVMTYSNLILPLSLLWLILWLHQRKWWQLGLAVLITFALLLTMTRSVWLGWGAAVLVLLMMTRTQIRYYVPALLLLFVSFLPLSLFSRLTSTWDMKLESNFDRLRMLEAGVEMIKDFPVLGVGPANVKEMYALYKKQDAPRIRPAHLHNNAIQIWAERGILGLTAYLLFLALFIRECLLARAGPARMWSDVGIAIAVALTVAGLFEFNFGDTEVFYLTLNLFAMVAVAIERPERLSNEVAPIPVPAAA
jgi:putative inorganic carbon (HCO3(-)) transporter